MPRRASSGLNPGILVGIVVAIAAAFIGGKVFFGKRDEQPLKGSVLEMRAVTENGNSLRGNSYVLEGKLDGKLSWTADRGQVVSVEVEDDDGTNFLAIEIPPNLSKVNIEREQNYVFQVRFRQGGIAVAEQITRR